MIFAFFFPVRRAKSGMRPPVGRPMPQRGRRARRVAAPKPNKEQHR
jgi:hypothetical protein